jgi:hypothetical protein
VIKIPGSLGGSVLALTGAILLAGVAGCGGGTSSKSEAAVTLNQHSASAYSTAQPTSSPAMQGTVEASHDTPQDAVAGLLHAELSGNFPLACSYIDPSSQSTCLTEYSQAQSVPTFTGSGTVVGAVISGDKALVEITGNVCTTGNGCQGNSDPSEGMPTGSTTFAQAYNNVFNLPANANSTMSPVPCELINKSWYVNYDS